MNLLFKHYCVWFVTLFSNSNNVPIYSQIRNNWRVFSVHLVIFSIIGCDWAGSNMDILRNTVKLQQLGLKFTALNRWRSTVLHFVFVNNISIIALKLKSLIPNCDICDNCQSNVPHTKELETFIRYKLFKKRMISLGSNWRRLILIIVNYVHDYLFLKWVPRLHLVPSSRRSKSILSVYTDAQRGWIFDTYRFSKRSGMLTPSSISSATFSKTAFTFPLKRNIMLFIQINSLNHSWHSVTYLLDVVSITVSSTLFKIPYFDTSFLVL